MTTERTDPPMAVNDVCATALQHADLVRDPVDRLAVLAHLADSAASALRDIEAATSRAVHQALKTMTLDELSSQLNQSLGNTLFLAESFIVPTPEGSNGEDADNEPDAAAKH